MTDDEKDLVDEKGLVVMIFCARHTKPPKVMSVYDCIPSCQQSYDTNE